MFVCYSRLSLVVSFILWNFSLLLWLWLSRVCRAPRFSPKDCRSVVLTKLSDMCTCFMLGSLCFIEFAYFRDKWWLCRISTLFSKIVCVEHILLPSDRHSLTDWAREDSVQCFTCLYACVTWCDRMSLSFRSQTQKHKEYFNFHFNFHFGTMWSFARLPVVCVSRVRACIFLEW